MSDLLPLILLVLIGFSIFLYFKFFKIPRLGALTLITGGVKTGKSAFTVALALKSYKRALRMYKVRRIFARIFGRKVPERPLLYSNVPLRNVDYVPVSRSILLREVRIAEKSVMLLDEASLVADSMLIRNQQVNTELLLFFKLYGHESHGGKLFINSQCISDLHYSIKRCTSDYYYIHHLTRFPFVSCFSVRQERYSEDGTAVNSYDEDVDKSLMRVMMFNGFFKKYDCYCYSVLTDSLESSTSTRKLSRKDSLKLDKICSFRDEYNSLIQGGDSNA